MAGVTRIDHNMDNTTAMLREWLKKGQGVYHYVEWRPMEEPKSVTVHAKAVHLLCQIHDGANC